MLKAATAEIAEILHPVPEGRDLSREEACRLISARGSDLDALLLAANLLREHGKGNTVTYSRKAFFPLTNVCRNHCAYCTFVRRPGDGEAHLMSPAEIRELAAAARSQGCKEALFTCGERPEARWPWASQRLAEMGYKSLVKYLIAMCRLVVEEAGLLPHSNPGVLEREELAALGEVNASLGLMLESTSYRLCEAGGPHAASPGKWPDARLATIATAGELGIPFTTGILIGIGETAEERVDALLAIKDLQRRYGHIQEVIIQNFRAKAGTPMGRCKEPRPLEMLRTIATARMILGGEMNIQAPPNLSPDVYQLYLLAGLNDWGGISPLTVDHINPEAAWPNIDELAEVTSEAGYLLRERLAVYPEYVGRRREQVSPGLARAMAALADEEGYAKGGGDGDN